MMTLEQVRELTREEWLERRADVRRRQSLLATERSQAIRDEQSFHHQTMKSEYDRHHLRLQNIDADYREAKQRLADEMDVLSAWNAPQGEEGGQS